MAVWLKNSGRVAEKYRSGWLWLCGWHDVAENWMKKCLRGASGGRSTVPRLRIRPPQILPKCQAPQGSEMQVPWSESVLKKGYFVGWEASAYLQRGAAHPFGLADGVPLTAKQFRQRYRIQNMVYTRITSLLLPKKHKKLIALTININEASYWDPGYRFRVGSW